VPLFDCCESRGVEVYLSRARQAKHAPGRPKSDLLDCQWLQRLHSYGLADASFRPASRVCAARYLRQADACSATPPSMCSTCTRRWRDENKLAEVVSDVTG